MKRFTSLSILAVLFLSSISAYSVRIVNAQETPSVKEVVIESVANELKFDLAEITAESGQTVHLVFNNMASVKGMSHNVVFLQDEESIDRVGVAAISAAASDYIPEDDAILFFTPLAAPGETVEVTFVAPDPGTYYFVCTYLGHYILMRGVFVVS